MSNLKIKTFYEWIQTYKTDTNIEIKTDLIEDILSDKDFHSHKNEKKQIIHYLNYKRACDSALETFKELWSEYIKYRGRNHE